MMDIFSGIAETETVKPLPPCEPWDEKKRLIHEKEALGLFLTGHPLKIVEKEIQQISSGSLAHWLEKLDTGESNGEAGRYRQREQQTTICGLVVDIRMKNTFNGREAFVTLDDRTGRIDVRVSPSLLQDIEDLLKKDYIWIVEGGIAYDAFNNGIKIRASNVCLLDDYRNQHARALHVHLNGQQLDEVDEIIGTLEQHRNSSKMPLVIHGQDKGYAYQLRTNGAWSVSISEECLLGLGKYLDCEQIHVEY